MMITRSEKPIPLELATIEHGQYAERLKSLREQSPKISPEEIYLALDPAKIEGVAQAKFARWGDRLEIWRNGLILLPLLIIWISLGLAVLAYSQTYSMHPGLPFLKQWVDGFSGTSLLVPNFNVVVGANALLIALLIALTVIVQSIKSRAGKRAAKLRSWLDEELYVLASNSLVKSSGQGIDPKWAVEVHATVSELTTILAGVQSLAELSQKSLVNLTSSSRATFKDLVQTSQKTFEDSTRLLSGAISEQRQIYTAITDRQQQMINTNAQLISLLQEIAIINKKHLDVEQNLSQQIYSLGETQQVAVNKNGEIAASMSTAAQAVLQLIDQLASQPQHISVDAGGDVVLNISKLGKQQDFDVFLCYNGKDKLAVKAIAEQLRNHGIKPWLDEWEIPPGRPWQSVLEEQISKIKSVAVFIGQDDLGPWQNLELRTFLQEFVERGCPVIPVVLPGYDNVDPDLPPFLRSLTWVDFRQKEPDPLEALTWGVAGRR